MAITEEDLDELYDKDEAAIFLHVSRTTIERMIRNREVDYLRVGSGAGRVRFTKRALLDLLNSREVKAERKRPKVVSRVSKKAAS